MEAGVLHQTGQHRHHFFPYSSEEILDIRSDISSDKISCYLFNSTIKKHPWYSSFSLKCSETEHVENAHGLEYTLSSPEVKTATSFKVFLKHSLASIKISLRLTLPVRAQTSLHGGKPQFRPVKIAHAPHVSPPLASQEFVWTEARYCPMGDLGRLPFQLLIAPPVAPGSPEAPPRGR